MRLLVCGGRHFDDWDLLSLELMRLLGNGPIDLIIHGGAPGADRLAQEFADMGGIHSRSFAADWKAHGKAAGPLRNQQMLDEGKPDLVMAFPGGTGTADMVRRAKAAGVPVKEISYPPH